MNEHIELLDEFDNHKLVSFVFDKESKLEAYIALHRGSLTSPSFGATRIVKYKQKEDALRDALRLSRLMSYKAAMAGLDYGGGKGVIILPDNVSDAERARIIECYCEALNYYGGHFVTGADVGITDADMKTMHKNSQYIVGVESNPVLYTAQGIFKAIEYCVQRKFEDADLGKRSFAIQGVGKIGTALLDQLYGKAAKIVITDVDSERLKEVQVQYPDVEVVTPANIYKQAVDVFSPCALSNSLTSQTITQLKASIVCGGANNQLQDQSVGELLHSLGILYAPDYVVNCGGLISVVDEYEHKQFDGNRVQTRLNNIVVILKEIFTRSQMTNRATNLIADEMAEEIFNSR
jgi:leucine dehydrogenase